VNYKIIEKAPKSARSARTLHLPADLQAALSALHDLQAIEAIEAGEAYAGSGYVAADELVAPRHPEALSGLFEAVRKVAGLPKITLHDGRHTALSQLILDGTPVSIVSKWAGHASVAFTLAPTCTPPTMTR
jgi:integrase